MLSEEADHVSPMTACTDVGRRDSGHLVVSSTARRSDAEPTLSRGLRWDEAVGKPRKPGRMRTSA